MNLLEQAYKNLYRGAQPNLEFFLEYSGHFREYGGAIKLYTYKRKLACKVSSKWKGVADSIQIGFLQLLIAKVNRTKTQTMEMELYHNFIHNLSKHAVKSYFEPVLSEAFDEVNTVFFDKILDKPNLHYRNSKNPLGAYEYATDTISISRILLQDKELLKYVLYHEMLHKKHGYKQQGTRQCSHSAAFRADEKKFPNWQILEKKLAVLVRTALLK
ncbi:MAG: M48 family metallopeptidase [Candidatus Aenigmarchaeota archaeon]|nr:M48 family metallopeptidase [Candidatus Aenigmarchaeota archaeon]